MNGVTQDELAEDRVAAMETAAAAVEVGERAAALYGRALGLDRVVRNRRRTLDELTDNHPDRELLLRLSAEVDKALDELEEIREEQYALVAAAMHWRYTVDEVRSWCERAETMGAYHPRIDAALLEDLIYVRQVPVEPIRRRLQELIDADAEDRNQNECGHDQRYMDNPINQELCEVLGWDRRSLYRNLGLHVSAAPRPGGRKSLPLFIEYELALKLAPLLGLTPRQVGV